MIDKILTLLQNPIIVIALTVIILVVLLTQKSLVGKLLRKYLKLNTDDETIQLLNKFSKLPKLKQKKTINKEFLKSSKTELIGGRPNDR